MLPALHRLTEGADFRAAVRTGHRAGARTMALHLAGQEPGTPVRVGFVVSRAVGGAVRRNQVRRRLRHLARERLPALPASSQLVIRALPPAALASYGELGHDLDRCLTRVTS